jgi:hypothetical protein
MLANRFLAGCGLLLVALACTPVRASDSVPAIVVTLKPGESKEVTVVWDEVPITRAAFLWGTTKARITKQEEIDGNSEVRSNGAGIAIDMERTKRLEKILTPSDPKPATTTVTGALKVHAEDGAKPGITKLYARWGGGQGAVDLRSVEIRIVIGEK